MTEVRNIYMNDGMDCHATMWFSMTGNAMSQKP